MNVLMLLLVLYLTGLYLAILLMLWRDKMIRRQYQGRFPVHLELLDERRVLTVSATSWVLVICFIGALCMVPRSQWWRANAPRRRP